MPRRKEPGGWGWAAAAIRRETQWSRVPTYLHTILNLTYHFYILRFQGGVFQLENLKHQSRLASLAVAKEESTAWRRTVTALHLWQMRLWAQGRSPCLLILNLPLSHWEPPFQMPPLSTWKCCAPWPSAHPSAYSKHQLSLLTALIWRLYSCNSNFQCVSKFTS